jgi:hypothetical protein
MRVGTTNIPVNRIARRLEENIGKYAGGGSETAGGRCRVLDPWRLPSVSSV